VEPGDAESVYRVEAHSSRQAVNLQLSTSTLDSIEPSTVLTKISPSSPPLRAAASIIGTHKNITPMAPIPLDVLRKKIVFGDAIDRNDKEELEEAESHSHAGFTRELHHPRVLRTKGQHLRPLYMFMVQSVWSTGGAGLDTGRRYI
jgi:hypothetical protein